MIAERLLLQAWKYNTGLDLRDSGGGLHFPVAALLEPGSLGEAEEGLSGVGGGAWLFGVPVAGSFGLQAHLSASTSCLCPCDGANCPPAPDRPLDLALQCYC